MLFDSSLANVAFGFVVTGIALFVGIGMLAEDSRVPEEEEKPLPVQEKPKPQPPTVRQRFLHCIEPTCHTPCIITEQLRNGKFVEVSRLYCTAHAGNERRDTPIIHIKEGKCAEHHCWNRVLQKFQFFEGQWRQLTDERCSGCDMKPIIF